MKINFKDETKLMIAALAWCGGAFLFWKAQKKSTDNLVNAAKYTSVWREQFGNFGENGGNVNGTRIQLLQDKNGK
nr:MAG TPA: hypothetical protein [Caudoviricetes sp.]